MFKEKYNFRGIQREICKLKNILVVDEIYPIATSIGDPPQEPLLQATTETWL